MLLKVLSPGAVSLSPYLWYCIQGLQHAKHADHPEQHPGPSDSFSPRIVHTKKIFVQEAGDMDQHLRTVAALPEALDSVPSTRMADHKCL